MALTKYSLSKDKEATKLTLSKNPATKILITKNPGFPKCCLVKSGGILVNVVKGESIYGPVTGGEVLLESDDALLLETGYILLLEEAEFLTIDPGTGYYLADPETDYLEKQPSA